VLLIPFFYIFRGAETHSVVVHPAVSDPDKSVVDPDRENSIPTLDPSTYILDQPSRYLSLALIETALHTSRN
jgi:hypothetical protein